MVLELDGVAQNPPPVHSFKNEYFKYHGKWQTGLVKSGPGALLMDDGKTYVTCNFTNGEIDGEGTKPINTSASSRVLGVGANKIEQQLLSADVCLHLQQTQTHILACKKS